MPGAREGWLYAGRLFDLTQGYGTAVLLAAAGNVAGIVCSLGLPRQQPAASQAALRPVSEPSRVT